MKIRNILPTVFFAIPFLGLAFFFACTATEPGKSYYSVIGDSSWLKLDSLIIIRRESSLDAGDTVFHGKLYSLETLKRLQTKNFYDTPTHFEILGFSDSGMVLYGSGTIDGNSKIISRDSSNFDNLSALQELQMEADSATAILNDTISLSIRTIPASKLNDFACALPDASPFELLHIPSSKAMVGVRCNRVGQSWLHCHSLRDSSKRDSALLTADYAPLIGIKVRPNPVRLKEGGYQDSLFAEPIPANANPKFSFLSDDIEKVTVNSFGVLRSRNSGKTEIRILGTNFVVDSVPVEVMANQKPIIMSVSKPNSIKMRDTLKLNLQALDRDGVIAKVFWKSLNALDSGIFNSDQIQTSKSFVYNDPGKYEVILQVIDNDGVSESDTVRIAVLRGPPKVDLGKQLDVFTREKINLHADVSDSLGKIQKIEWKIGKSDFQLGSADTQFVAPSQSGLLVCYARVTDDDGNQDTDSILVQILNDTKALLDSLSVSPGHFDTPFKPRNLNYVDTVDAGTDTVHFRWSASPYVSRVEFNGHRVSRASDTAVALDRSGYQLIQIDVWAEDSTVRVRYAVAIFRRPSDDATLKSLEIEYGDDLIQGILNPIFSTNKFEYSIAVPDTISEIRIKPITKLPSSSIKFEGIKLSDSAMLFHCDPGATRITLTVTAENGGQITYRIKVYRNSWVKSSSYTPPFYLVTGFEFFYWNDIPVLFGSSENYEDLAIQYLSGTWAPLGRSYPREASNFMNAHLTNNGMIQTTCRFSRRAETPLLAHLRLNSSLGNWTIKRFDLPIDTSLYLTANKFYTAPIGDSIVGCLNYRLGSSHHEYISCYASSPTDSIKVVDLGLDTTCNNSVIGMATSKSFSYVAVSSSHVGETPKFQVLQFNGDVWSRVGSDPVAMPCEWVFAVFGVVRDTLFFSYLDSADQNKIKIFYSGVHEKKWHKMASDIPRSTNKEFGLKVSVSGDKAFLTFSRQIDKFSTGDLNVYQLKFPELVKVGEPGNWGSLAGYTSYALQYDSKNRLHMALKVGSQGQLLRYYDPQAEGE